MSTLGRATAILLIHLNRPISWQGRPIPRADQDCAGKVDLIRSHNRGHAIVHGGGATHWQGRRRAAGGGKIDPTVEVGGSAKIFLSSTHTSGTSLSYCRLSMNGFRRLSKKGVRAL